MSKFFSSKKFQVTVIVVLTFLAYSNIFQNGFVSDDRGFILSWANSKKLSDIPSVITGDGPPFRKEATYRPVRDVLYVIYGQLFGKNTFGWHLHGMAVLLASTALVYLIVRKISADSMIHSRSESKLSSREHFGSVTRFDRNSTDKGKGDVMRWLPFLAALLFGLHPIHTEAITFMTSSMDMIGPLFMFAAFLLYMYANEKRIRKRMYANERILKVGSVILAGLAFFSYEITLVLPLLLVLYEWTLGSYKLKVKSYKSLKAKIPVFWPYFAIGGIYLVIRVFVVNRHPFEANYWIDSTSFNWSRVMSPEVIVKYFEILIYPKGLSFNHVIRPEFDTFLNWVNDPGKFNNYSLVPAILALFSIIVLIGIAARFRKSWPIVSFSIFWFFISILPVANLLPQPTLLAERYLFIASFGFILGICYLALWANEKIGAYIFLVFILICAVLTYMRNIDWKDEIGLWESVTREYPQSALGYNNIGQTYIEQEKYYEAIPFYKKALELRPNYFYARNDLATAYKRIGEIGLSETEYKKAIETKNSYFNSYQGLTEIYKESGREQLAIETLVAALGISRKDTPLPESEFKKTLSSINKELGEMYEGQGQVEKAFDHYDQALKLNPKDDDTGDTIHELVVANPSIWPKKEAEFGSFSYPQFWEFVDQGEKYTLISEDRHFRVDIEFSLIEISAGSYLAKREDNYGEVVSEEYLDVPNFDLSYVRVWKDNLNHKIQFLLFKKGKVVEIVAYPSESELKPIIDGIISTLRVDDTNINE